MIAEMKKVDEKLEMIEASPKREGEEGNYGLTQHQPNRASQQAQAKKTPLLIPLLINESLP